MKITGKAVIADETPRYVYGRRVRRTWIMVVDRKKAHVFAKTHQGLEHIADAQPEPSDEGQEANTRDNGHVSGAAVGHVRSTVDHRERLRQHEQSWFSRGLSQWLDAQLNQDNFDDVVLVASKRMLGDIRGQLSEHVRARVIREIAKDLTNLPTQDIRRNLSNVLYFRD